MGEVTRLLEELATKLGTTVQFLWPYLVRKERADWIAQASASGFAFLVVSILLIVAAVLLKKKGDDAWSSPSFVPEVMFVISSAGFIASVIACICAFAAIGNFLVPEAAVIEHLIQLVRGR